MEFKRGLGSKNALCVGEKHITDKWLKDNGIIDRYEKNSGELMHVIHIDSENEMTSEQILFIKCLITNVKTDLIAMGFYYLLNHIPIFIVGKEIFKKLSPVADHKVPGVEYFGWYQRVSLANIPTIYICLERIKDFVDNNQQKFKALGVSIDVLSNYMIAKVVLHEFAHALMDNPAFDFDLSDEQKEAFDWIEEPMANALVLHIAEKLKKEPNFFKTVKKLISGQPLEYKRGIEFFDNGIHCDWINWATIKKNASYPNPRSSLQGIKEFLATASNPFDKK